MESAIIIRIVAGALSLLCWACFTPVANQRPFELIRIVNENLVLCKSIQGYRDRRQDSGS